MTRNEPRFFSFQELKQETKSCLSTPSLIFPSFQGGPTIIHKGFIVAHVAPSPLLSLSPFALFGQNDLIAIPRLARAGKQSFCPNRQKKRERREEGATICHNNLLPSKVAKD